MEDELVKYGDGCVRVRFTGNGGGVGVSVGGGGRRPREGLGGGEKGIVVRGCKELRAFGCNALDAELGRYWSRGMNGEFLGLC